MGTITTRKSENGKRNFHLSVFSFQFKNMWPFSKKKTITESGILNGITDHHSHILPGVDDGVESMDEALHILAAYENAGVKELWFTPHIMEDVPNTPEMLKARFNELQTAYSGKIKLNLAAEYMIDNHLRKLLQDCHSKPQGESPAINDLFLPIGGKGNHLLVETSYYTAPMRLHETLKRIKAIGLHPLLAHPERYMYMDKEEYIALHEEGIKFQLNLPSICGAYGKAVKKKAEWLLEKGLYDAIGSDTHCEEGVEYLLESKVNEYKIKALHCLLSGTQR